MLQTTALFPLIDKILEKKGNFLFRGIFFSEFGDKSQK